MFIKNLLAKIFKLLAGRGTFVRLYTYIFEKLRRILGIVLSTYYGVHPKHVFDSYHLFFIENIEKDDAVLDIGCGSGYLTKAIGKKCKTVVGVDKKPSLIQKAKKYNALPNISYICKDIFAFEFQKFDVVTMSNVLEHLKNDEKLLSSLHEHTDKLLIRVPIYRNWYSLVKKDLGMNYYSDSSHFREYTTETIKKVLSVTNWRIYRLEFKWDFCPTILLIAVPKTKK